MVTLFCPPRCILNLHIKSLFEKNDLVGFWTWMEWDFGTLPMIEGSRTNSCTKINYNSINIHHETKTQKCNTYMVPLKLMLWLGIPITIPTSWYKVPIVLMYITYNICIMNSYSKKKFGNTHIELLNLPSLKMFTYATPRLYLKPTMSKNPM